LTALPDHLLRSILRRAWADRPPRPAAEEVRAAAILACVCRRVRELLRAQPLPLDLDFSAARLSGAQRSWLLDPAQAGRVEAARFLVDCDEGSEDALWEQPDFDNFLARHGDTLLHLSGIPLRLVASVSQGEAPALDLSGLRLTRLGINCLDVGGLADGTWAERWWLWPKCLPGGLEELALLALREGWLEMLAWAPHSGAGLAERLPRLRTLHMVYEGGEEPLMSDSVPLLEGFPVLPAFEVKSLDSDVAVHADLLGRVRSVRVVTGGRVVLWNEQVIPQENDVESVAAFVNSLCPAGLQAAELYAERGIDLGPDNAAQTGVVNEIMHEIVRDMVSRVGDRFAVEVRVPEQPPGHESWDMTVQNGLARRRWPAPGAPGLQAARAAHERARAWAAEVEEWLLSVRQ